MGLLNGFPRFSNLIETRVQSVIMTIVIGATGLPAERPFSANRENLPCRAAHPSGEAGRTRS